MSNPRLKGDKNIEGEIDPDSPAYGMEGGKYVKKTNTIGMPDWRHMLYGRFLREYPGLLSLILSLLLTVFVTFIAGVVIILVADKVATDINAAVLGPSLGGIIIGLCQFAIIYAVGWLTMEKNFRTYILPEQYWTMIITGKSDVLTAILFSAMSFLGFMISGFTLRSFVNGPSPNKLLNQPVINVATDTFTYLIYWLGGSIIQFMWIWCTQYRNDKTESDDSKYHRGLLAISALTFGFVLAFYGAAPGHGLVVFSPGLYLTGLIYNDMPNRSFAGDTINPWATFIFIGLFVVPITAMILHVVFNWHASYMLKNEPGNIRKHAPPATMGMEMKTTGQPSAKKRTPVIEY